MCVCACACVCVMQKTDERARTLSVRLGGTPGAGRVSCWSPLADQRGIRMDQAPPPSGQQEELAGPAPLLAALAPPSLRARKRRSSKSQFFSVSALQRWKELPKGPQSHAPAPTRHSPVQSSPRLCIASPLPPLLPIVCCTS